MDINRESTQNGQIMRQEYGQFNYAYEGGAATDDAPDIAKEREINAQCMLFCNLKALMFN